ncbi:hypothetical protein D3C75_948120 [compost metagenome]
MGNQYQPERQEQPGQGIAFAWPALVDQPGQQQGQPGEHEQGMRKAAVVGHLRHRVGVADDHVQVGKRAQRRTI